MTRRPAPRYVYDLSQIRLRHEELRESCGGSGLYYSVKANSHAGVLAYIAGLGLRAEISSPGELRAALEAGFNARECLFGGPGKTAGDLGEVAALGVRTFSLESVHELGLLLRLEANLGAQFVKLARLWTPAVAGGVTMMGPNSKFGISIEELAGFLQGTGARLDGIHFYVGTQLPETLVFEDHVRLTNDLVEMVERLQGARLQIVNYGGGLAWPFMQDGSNRIQRSHAPAILRDRSCWFEFGRYLVASCGRLYLEVVDRKLRGDRQIIVLSAGLNAIGGMAAAGRVLPPTVDFALEGSSAPPAGALLPSAVYGPLCTPLDYLSLKCLLPPLEIGQELSIPNCGAYGFGTGLHQFLRRAPIVEEARGHA